MIAKLKEMNRIELIQLKNSMNSITDQYYRMALTSRLAMGISCELDMTIKYNIITCKLYKRSLKINDDNITVNDIINHLIQKNYASNRKAARELIYNMLAYRICVVI